MRPLRAEIDLSAIQHNYQLLASKSGGAECIAVVKADAYGHGIVPVAEALSPHAGKLAVACFEEALKIRQAAIESTIVVLEGFFSAQELLEGAQAGGIEWVIHDHNQLQILRRSERLENTRVWLKINTGMNRLGFPQPELPALLNVVKTDNALQLQGVMSHFACADEPDSECFQQQLSLVRKLRQSLPAQIKLSVANTAAILLHSGLGFQQVRPGIGLYGGSPVAAQQGVDFGLRPAMGLYSAVMACRDLVPGDAVGYGASWQADKAIRMGVVAIGYGDGYPRQIGSGSPVVVNGVETTIIGRVSMDMITVDLTNIESAGVGSEVELWGSTLSVDRVARHADSIAYHLLTGVTQRVPRIYRE